MEETIDKNEYRSIILSTLRVRLPESSGEPELARWEGKMDEWQNVMSSAESRYDHLADEARRNRMLAVVPLSPTAQRIRLVLASTVIVLGMLGWWLT